MSDNVTWEPVESGWCDVTEAEDTGSSIGWDGVFVSIMMEGELSWRKLPPDIRLCRAKQVDEAPPAPAWSQEPPTTPGDWWLWNSDEPDIRPFPLPLVCTNGVWRFLLNDGRYIRTNDMPPTAWYMPATVPQPPRLP